MSLNKEEKLEQYIYKLMKVKEDLSQSFTHQTIAKVADELGLTDEDMALFRQEAQKHAERGLTYQKAKRWPAAAEEFKSAADLMPLNPSYQHALSELYFNEWKSTGKKEALAKCEAAIANCLAIAPSHAPSQQLLQNIAKAKGGMRTKRIFKGILFGLLLLLAVLGGLFILAEAGVFAPPPTGLEGKSYAIPATAEPSPELAGMDMEIQALNVIHDDYVGARTFSFDLIGRVRYPNHDLRMQRLGIDFFDGSGALTASHYVWVTGSTYAQTIEQAAYTVPAGIWVYLNGGNSWVHTLGEGVPQKMAKAAIRHDLLDRLSPVPAGQAPLPLQWEGQAPEGMAFEGTKLFEHTSKEESVAICHYSFAIKNTGTRPCRELLLEIRRIDERGNAIYAEEAKVIVAKNKPLAPGESMFYAYSKYFHKGESPAGAADGRWVVAIKLAN